jgi:ribosomal protein L40E
MSALVAGIGLAVLVVAWVLYPVIAGVSAPMGRDDEEVTETQHRKRMALLALRDVEYDFHSGKLDESDYRTMKARISSEALAALEDEEREWEAREGGGSGTGQGASAGEPSSVELEIAALRASLREGAVCRECGEPNPPGSRYCGSCGSALPKPSPPAGRP